MTALVEALPPRFTAADRDTIERAYAFAARRHAGQKRRSGDPYLTHLVAVAEIAVEVGLDADAVCAALLHDVIAETGCDVARLRAGFGDGITRLVQDLTELKHPTRTTPTGAVDERVLVLKVLDRLHNMRTIQPLDPAKRELKSRQTIDVIAPLAAHLGLTAIADELVSIARRHVPAGPMQRLLAVGSLLLPVAFRQSYLDEWLGELDVVRGRGARARFVAGLIRGMPALSMSLRRPPGRVLAGRMLDALRWVLRSQVRTWTPLVLLLAWMTLETARSSPGDAVAVLITVPPVLHAGVKRLRRALR